jgi:hypothetical protein
MRLTSGGKRRGAKHLTGFLAAGWPPARGDRWIIRKLACLVQEKSQSRIEIKFYFAFDIFYKQGRERGLESTHA